MADQNRLRRILSECHKVVIRLTPYATVFGVFGLLLGGMGYVTNLALQVNGLTTAINGQGGQGGLNARVTGLEAKTDLLHNRGLESVELIKTRTLQLVDANDNVRGEWKCAKNGEMTFVMSAPDAPNTQLMISSHGDVISMIFRDGGRKRIEMQVKENTLGQFELSNGGTTEQKIRFAFDPRKPSFEAFLPPSNGIKLLDGNGQWDTPLRNESQ